MASPASSSGVHAQRQHSQSQPVLHKQTSEQSNKHNRGTMRREDALKERDHNLRGHAKLSNNDKRAFLDWTDARERKEGTTSVTAIDLHHWKQDRQAKRRKQKNRAANKAIKRQNARAKSRHDAPMKESEVAKSADDEQKGDGQKSKAAGVAVPDPPAIDLPFRPRR